MAWRAWVCFHADHLDDLAPPTERRSAEVDLSVPEEAVLWTHALGEKGRSTSASSVSEVLAKRPFARVGIVSDLERVLTGLNDTERRLQRPGQGSRNRASKPRRLFFFFLFFLPPSTNQRATDSSLEADDTEPKPGKGADG